MWGCKESPICDISKKNPKKTKSERAALLYAVHLYWLILGIIFPAARMCPYCFPIPVCLKEVPVWFFSQQKQHSAEKNCSKTGLLDLNWFKELLRSLALIFFFFFPEGFGIV